VKAAAPSDYRALARRRLPHFLFEYLDGGSYGEVTLARNSSDLDGIALRQRVMRDISEIDLTTTLFGQRLAMPVALAPVGLAGLYARRGEVQAVQAAEKAGIPFCLSTVSACPMDEVARGASKPFWFQLYMIRDRAFMHSMLVQAQQAQCSALIFTVDMPVPGSRYRDVRSGLAGASGIAGHLRRAGQAMVRPRWAWDVGLRGRPHHLGNVAQVLDGKTGLEDFFAWMRRNFDPTITWRDLEWVRAAWQGPLIVKGILDVEDAVRAVDLGADGVIVSNHGGRQLDGVPSSARALPAIAAAVGERTTVLVDGGVRSGLDVVRMLALGARCVLIGRAWMYGLASRGREGVEHVLQLIKDETQVAMGLTGCTRVNEISGDQLARL
jgi:L-lactate dehydrogenase (cytochrome)